jgi:hypothetical protein
MWYCVKSWRCWTFWSCQLGGTRSKGDIERIDTAIRADYEEYGIRKKAASSIFFQA